MKTTENNKLLSMLVIMASIFFSLALSEVALRLINFEFGLYPTKVQFGWPNPYKLQKYYRIDSKLLWVPKNYSTKIDYWKNRNPFIVFMGDSCTEFGRYDKELKSIYDSQDPHNNLTYVNLGVGGWSSFQGLQQLKRDVLPMKPQVITIYYGWNDHWTSFGIADKEIGKYNLKHSTLLVAIFQNVRLLQLVNKAVFVLENKTIKHHKRKPERVSILDFESNLRQMVRVARENGIVPILITAPSSHREGAEPVYLEQRHLNSVHELIPLHRKYVQIVRKVAAKENAPLLDLYKEFNMLPQKELEMLFQKDGIHLTPEGNLKIAESLHRYLSNFK